jgi:hypothetical protein
VTPEEERLLSRYLTLTRLLVQLPSIMRPLDDAVDPEDHHAVGAAGKLLPHLQRIAGELARMIEYVEAIDLPGGVHCATCGLSLDVLNGQVGFQHLTEFPGGAAEHGGVTAFEVPVDHEPVPVFDAPRRPAWEDDDLPELRRAADTPTG